MSAQRRLILRITQSPMNPSRWALDLECGHEAWMTAKSRPTRKFYSCLECSPRRRKQKP